MWRFVRNPGQPKLVIRRRPSDFMGRGRALLQVGCCCCGGGATCCCCCCCLHWVGAAVGGTAGILAASPPQKKEPDSPARRFGKGHLLWATWIAALAAAALLVIVLTGWEEVFWVAGPVVILFAAAIGGVAGMIVAGRAGKKVTALSVDPVARRCVLGATWLGLLGTAAFITVAPIWLAATGPPNPTKDVIAATLVPLLYLPSLALLPVGAAAMLGAAVAKWIATKPAPDPAERERTSSGLGLAWRIAWMSFVWSTFASGVGYLVMYVIALFLD